MGSCPGNLGQEKMSMLPSVIYFYFFLLLVIFITTIISIIVVIRICIYIYILELYIIEPPTRYFIRKYP